MAEPTIPMTGGCRCGATRIRVTKPPLLTSVCHCTGCQTMSASAFSTTVAVPGDAFEVIQGEPVLAGRDKTIHHFCPECMTWMFTKVPTLDMFVNVRATMFADHRWFVPFVETFIREKLPWAMTPAAYSYETIPEMAEWQMLTEKYAEALKLSD